MIFACIVVPETPPQNEIPSTICGHFLQDTSKMHPRCPLDAPKTPPRHLYEPPGHLQVAYGQPKDASKLPQVALKHPKNDTKLKDLIQM